MRGIRRLQDPGAGTSAPAAFQFDPPARRAQADIVRRRRRGRRGDPPAAERGRAGHGPALARPAAIGPPVQHHAEAAPPLAGQLQAAAGGQVRRLGLADGGGDPLRGQRVLQHRQGLGLVAGANLDQPSGREAEARQARREEVVAPRHPDDGPGLDPRGEQRPQQQAHEGRRRGAGLVLQPRPRHLVPAAQRQAAAGEAAVDGRIAERQDRSRSPSPRFDRGDPASQGRKTRLARSGHPPLHVPLLF